MLIKKIGGLFLVAVFLLAGCGGDKQRNLTPEEESYLQRAMAFSLEFRLPNNQSEEAWGRGQEFISRFSYMSIQTATQNVVATYNPNLLKRNDGFGYRMSRAVQDNETLFRVECTNANPEYTPESNRNAHLLAYYMATGLISSNLVYRVILEDDEPKENLLYINKISPVKKP